METKMGINEVVINGTEYIPADSVKSPIKIVILQKGGV